MGRRDARIDDGSEAALLDGLRRGEAPAYEQLVRRNAGRLLAVTRRLLDDDEDARDAVQDTFLSAFRSIGSFGGQSSLSTWLHRIAVNAALMKLRTQRRRPERSIEELLPRFLEDGHHAHPPGRWPESTERLLARAETARIVHAAIRRLPRDYRNVVLLRDIEGLSTEETAAMLGTSSNAAKVRLHRARQALRTLLDRDLGGAPA